MLVLLLLSIIIVIVIVVIMGKVLFFGGALNYKVCSPLSPFFPSQCSSSFPLLFKAWPAFPLNASFPFPLNTFHSFPFSLKLISFSPQNSPILSPQNSLTLSLQNSLTLSPQNSRTHSTQLSPPFPLPAGNLNPSPPPPISTPHIPIPRRLVKGSSNMNR